MLQAYATQEAIEKLGYSCELINYRMKTQKEFYTLLRTRYGINNMINDLLLLPDINKRILRAAKFELFMEKYMKVSQEYNEPEQLEELKDAYDIVVSGSDQIWNKQSNELARAEFKYITPYYLKQFNCRKISYASSLAGMDDEYLQKVEPLLRQFSHVSMREEAGVKRMKEVLGYKTTNVLDPTFLLKGTEWAKKLNLQEHVNGKKYYMYYSLSGGKHGYLEATKALSLITDEICMKQDANVIAITPFLHIKATDCIVPIVDAGPREFLSLLYNSIGIITNSYHGTILSVNLNKPFVSLCNVGVADNRKIDILKKLNLDDQIITSGEDIIAVNNSIDYKNVNSILEILRKASMDYLMTSLKE